MALSLSKYVEVAQWFEERELLAASNRVLTAGAMTNSTISGSSSSSSGLGGLKQTAQSDRKSKGAAAIESKDNKQMKDVDETSSSSEGGWTSSLQRQYQHYRLTK